MTFSILIFLRYVFMQSIVGPAERSLDAVVEGGQRTAVLPFSSPAQKNVLVSLLCHPGIPGAFPSRLMPWQV